jgi:cyanophycinase
MSFSSFNRRQLLALGASALSLPAMALSTRPGRLVVVGGAEDRLKDKVILRRFLSLCGGERANVLVLTAASSDQAASWLGYEQVFREMGATQTTHLPIHTLEDANSADTVNRILNADGIFMSGGDQRRLMARLIDTEAARAMHTAFHLRRCCIGGTSAGAAVMSHIMLAEGGTPVLPKKDAAVLEEGLGFVPNAIIDQHFSERRRLGRLMSVLAQRPDLLGVGIDEDTALIIERGTGVEVVGNGVVTLIDGRRMRSNFGAAAASEHLEMLGVTLHVLPAGNRYSSFAESAGGTSSRLPGSLRSAITELVEPGPIRG